MDSRACFGLGQSDREREEGGRSITQIHKTIINIIQVEFRHADESQAQTRIGCWMQLKSTFFLNNMYTITEKEVEQVEKEEEEEEN